MVPDLFFSQLVLIALVWLCLLLHWIWPSDPAPCPPTPAPTPPVPKRQRERTPFAGLTTKPHCDACAHTIAPRSQAPSAPHRCIVPLRGRRRQVDPSHHTVRHWLVDTAEQLRAFSAYFLCDVHVRQLQLDEVYAVLRDVKTGALSEAEVIAHLERSPAWVWSAMDPDSKLLLVSDVGTRTLAMAQRVVHQVVQVLAPHCIPLCVTDGLKDDGTAFLTHCGSWIQPARRRDKGPLPKPRWMPLPELLYAQVVKSYRRRRIVGVTYRVVFGTMERVQQGLSACGRKINTAFAERLNLDLRQRVAAVGRRVNTLCQGEDGLRQQLVVYHASDHFCLPHASLRQPLLVPEPTNGRGSATRWRPCTPAMAASLTDLCGRCARCSCTACRRGRSRRRSE